MLVSINIVAYNEEENIVKALSSALKQTHKNLEVILIDNASSDKTIKKAGEIYAKSESSIPFRIIENKKNIGFGGGHNVGFRNSRGELALCLNADCELDKDYVKYAVEIFKRNPEAGGAQGKLLNPKTNKIDTSGLLMFKNRRVINRGQGDNDTGQYNKAEEVWGVDGAAPMYRRSALEDTKIWNEYFDEDFFAYKEDIDLSWRMRLAGWKMYYEPKAVAFHERSAGEGASRNLKKIVRARRGISEFAKYHSFANQRLMMIKNEKLVDFFKDFFVIFPKEFLSWIYVLFFEKYGLRSAIKFFRLLPKIFKKRGRVMRLYKISNKDFRKWLL